MTALHSIGEAIRSALMLVPMPMVRILFVGTLLALLIWVLRLPASRTRPENGTRRGDENLKIPATIALVVQVVIYLML